MIAIAKASDTEREVLFGNAADRAGMTLQKAQELYEQHTGINDWKNIPEKYWNLALAEMNVPE